MLAFFVFIVLPLNASVTGWGSNDLSQLNIPTNLIGAKCISSGYWHGLAITKSNAAVAWGYNDYGQTNVPPGLSNNVVGIAAGYYHSLALKTNRTVVGWGITSNLYSADPDCFGQADIPVGLTNVIAISAGAFHSMALKSDGTVTAWGYDFYGQRDVPPNLSNVVAIACGNSFSLALRNDGTLAAWGDNYYGQTNLPPDLTNVVAIAAGGMHGLALKADGTVEGWGAKGINGDLSQDFGQENAPADLTNAVGVAAGFFHSLALTSDGTVRQWGDISHGQTNPPTNLKRVLALAGGYDCSYALLNDLPMLLNAPTNVVAATNKTASFTVSAIGITPMKAIWLRQAATNGSFTNLVSVNYNNGPTSQSFVGGSASVKSTNNATWGTNLLFTLSLSNSFLNLGNYSYFVVLTNAAGAATSSVATLSALAPPKISSQPASVASNPGGKVFFTVGASGSTPLYFQWFFISSGTTNPISGATTNVLELEMIRNRFLADTGTN